MAVRLPVVVSQSARRDPSAVNLEEQLITELMFTDGLDAALIGPMEQIAVDSTDHLCLEGFKGPFALLSWSPVEVVRLHLVRLGIAGHLRQPHQEKQASPAQGALLLSSGSRFIEHFQLEPGKSARHWVDLVRPLLEHRETKTFTIAGLAPRPPMASRPAGTAASPAPQPPEIKVPDAATSPTAPGKPSVPYIPLEDDEETWTHLDDLMEDLDRSDV